MADIDPFSRPLHGLDLHCLFDPTDQSVGYFQSSARADWERLGLSAARSFSFEAAPQLGGIASSNFGD
jgi:hypothetical protein